MDLKNPFLSWIKRNKNVKEYYFVYMYYVHMKLIASNETVSKAHQRILSLMSSNLLVDAHTVRSRRVQRWISSPQEALSKIIHKSFENFSDGNCRPLVFHDRSWVDEIHVVTLREPWSGKGLSPIWVSALQQLESNYSFMAYNFLPDPYHAR